MTLATARTIGVLKIILSKDLPETEEQNLYKKILLASSIFIQEITIFKLNNFRRIVVDLFFKLAEYI